MHSSRVGFIALLWSVGNMLNVMKCPNVLQESQMRIPSCFAALEDEARMIECALAVRSLPPEDATFIITVDATCLAVGVLPCSPKYSPTHSAVMLGGDWHWVDTCHPIIKARESENGHWSPEVPLTDIRPATYVMMLTIKRGDHSCEQIPLLELPLL